MTGFQVVWCKDWSKRTLRQPCECKHPPEAQMTIGQRLERHGKHQQIVLEGAVCMDCGTDVTGQLDRVQALSRCWDEHGWNYQLAMRLYALANFHHDFFVAQSSVPIWFTAAWGWSSKKIARCLQLTHEAAERAAVADA